MGLSSTSRRALTAALVVGVLLPQGASAKPAKLAKDIEDKAVSILEAGAKSGDFAARAMAIEGLGHAPKKAALPLVKEALEDKQWQVRRAVIGALLALKDSAWKRAVADAMDSPQLNAFSEVLPLLEPLGLKQALSLMMASLKAPGFKEPERYAKALAKRGGEWMVEGYLAALTALKKSPAALRAFVDELGALPLPGALPLYQKVLAKLPPETQAKVLEHVREAEEVTDLAFLKPLLKSKDAAVAFNVAVALAHRNDESGRALLMAAAGGEDAAKQLTALRALKHIAKDDIKPLLTPITKADTIDIELFRAAIEIHAALRNPKLGAYLDRQITATDQDRRAVSVQVLGLVKGKAALAQLHALLSDGLQAVQIGAAQALGDLADPASIPIIRERLFSDLGKPVKIALLKALGAIRTPEIVDTVRSELMSTSPAIKLAAVEALAAVRHEAALDDLKLMLRDHEPKVRQTALKAILELGPAQHLETFEAAMGWLDESNLLELTRIHGDKMLPHLRLALASNRAELRWASRPAIAALTKPRQVELYRELAVKSEYGDLRVWGLEQALALEGAKAIDLAAALAGDSEMPVRLRAMEALGELKATTSQEALIAALADPDERVRVYAAAALLKL